MYIFKKRKKRTVAAICAMLLVCMSLFPSIPAKASESSVTLPVATIEESDGQSAGYTLRDGLSATFSADGEVTFAEGGELNIDYCNPMHDDLMLSQMDEGYTKLVEYNLTIKTSGYSDGPLSGKLTVPLPSNCDGASAKIIGGESASSAGASSVTFPVTFNISSNNGGTYFSVEYKSGNGGSNESSSNASGSDSYAKAVAADEKVEIVTIKQTGVAVTTNPEVVIPADAFDMSMLKTDVGFVKAVEKVLNKKEVAEAESVTLYTGNSRCFSAKLADAFRETNKTIVMIFRHKGQLYRVTIPKGEDISLLLEENGFAGPLYIGAKLGTAEVIE